MKITIAELMDNEFIKEVLRKLYELIMKVIGAEMAAEEAPIEE